MGKTPFHEFISKFFSMSVRFFLLRNETGRTEAVKEMGKRMDKLSKKTGWAIEDNDFSFCQKYSEKIDRLEKDFEKELSTVHHTERSQKILRFAEDFGDLIVAMSRYPDYHRLTLSHRIVVEYLEENLVVFLFDEDHWIFSSEQEYVRFVEVVLDSFVAFVRYYEAKHADLDETLRREMLETNEPFLKSLTEVCETSKFTELNGILKDTVKIVEDYLHRRPFDEGNVEKIRRALKDLKDDDYSEVYEYTDSDEESFDEESIDRE